MIHFNSCFAQKAKTAVNPPSSLSRGVFASSVTTSLPLRLASLSEPTDPQAACLAPERRNHSLEMPSAFSVGFYYLEKLPTPQAHPAQAPQPPLRASLSENWLHCPLVNRLAVAKTTAWPRAWMTPGLTPLPTSPKSVCLDSSCFCWASFCLSV